LLVVSANKETTIQRKTKKILLIELKCKNIAGSAKSILLIRRLSNK